MGGLNWEQTHRFLLFSLTDVPSCISRVGVPPPGSILKGTSEHTVSRSSWEMMFLWAWNKPYASTHVILWQCDLLNESCRIHRSPLTPPCAVFHIAAMVKVPLFLLPWHSSAYLASVRGFLLYFIRLFKKKMHFFIFLKGVKNFTRWTHVSSDLKCVFSCCQVCVHRKRISEKEKNREWMAVSRTDSTSLEAHLNFV